MIQHRSSLENLPRLSGRVTATGGRDLKRPRQGGNPGHLDKSTAPLTTFMHSFKIYNEKHIKTF